MEDTGLCHSLNHHTTPDTWVTLGFVAALTINPRRIREWHFSVQNLTNQNHTPKTWLTQPKTSLYGRYFDSTGVCLSPHHHTTPYIWVTMKCAAALSIKQPQIQPVITLRQTLGWHWCVSQSYPSNSADNVNDTLVCHSLNHHPTPDILHITLKKLAGRPYEISLIQSWGCRKRVDKAPVDKATMLVNLCW